MSPAGSPFCSTSDLTLDQLYDVLDESSNLPWAEAFMLAMDNDGTSADAMNHRTLTEHDDSLTYRTSQEVRNASGHSNAQHCAQDETSVTSPPGSEATMPWEDQTVTWVNTIHWPASSLREEVLTDLTLHHMPPKSATYDAAADETNLYTCDDCHESFSTPEQLKQHAQRNKHYIFPCDWPECDRMYCRTDSCSRHCGRHKPPIQCNHCSEGFYRGDRLKEHVRKYHPGAALPTKKAISRKPRASRQSRIRGPRQAEAGHSSTAVAAEIRSRASRPRYPYPTEIIIAEEGAQQLTPTYEPLYQDYDRARRPAARAALEIIDLSFMPLVPPVIGASPGKKINTLDPDYMTLE